jgi:hypothetical protein
MISNLEIRKSGKCRRTDAGGIFRRLADGGAVWSLAIEVRIRDCEMGGGRPPDLW